MAEAHPVGFQWVMEAKARGATIIHVDPRFSRTSAVAHMHVPIRAGADIAFVGGLINYVLRNDKYFHEYVVNYTNAATIISEDYQDTEDLDGLFSGFDAEDRSYDLGNLGLPGRGGRAGRGARGLKPYQRREMRAAARGEKHGSSGAEAHPAPDTDPTLQHPRCVFQILKRHFARYTPEMVAEVGGVPAAQFREVARLITENSGRDRTTAFVYSLGWTQHTVGVQYIRTAAILQALLGNMGRPGGGIMALRGHASIQGSTDIPTLFDLLPGYLPMPFAHRDREDSLASYVEAEKVQNGFWANTSDYMVSLLKAYWGDVATADNDFCYDYLPRLTGDHGTYATVKAQIEGACTGYFLLGQNPAVGSANARMQRMGLANLDWLVVRDLVMIESATFWKDGPEIETGEMRTEDIETEVFFLPAAAHTEKDGSFTNTQRMLQWHHRRSSQPGTRAATCGSPTTWAAGSGPSWPVRPAEMDRPVLDLTWDYPTEGSQDEPSADAVLAEINGWDADGKPVSSYTQLKSDGSTTCGCWIYCGVRAGGVNQAARRKPGQEQSWVAPEWGWAWPANRRILYNRASADPDGKPWSERKAYVWWDEEAGQVDWPRRAGLHRRPGRRPTGRQRAPRGVAAISGTDPFIMQDDGKAWLFAPAGLLDGPLPAHYEPQESPVQQPALPAAAQPGARDHHGPAGPVPAQRRRARIAGVPVRAHHLPADRAPHGRRDVPVAALPGRAAAGDVLRGVARNWPPSAGSSTWAGPRSSPPAAPSRRGCWSPRGWRR